MTKQQSSFPEENSTNTTAEGTPQEYPQSLPDESVQMTSDVQGLAQEPAGASTPVPPKPPTSKYDLPDLEEFQQENSHVTTYIDEDGYVITRERRRKKRKKKKPRAALIVVIVILAIIVGVAVALLAVNLQMKSMITNTNQNAEVTVADASEDQIITYQGKKYKLNQDIVSVLIMGHDKYAETTKNGLASADMICVAAIDTKTGKINCIQIPRDSMVAVDEYGVDSNGQQGGYAGQITEQICLSYCYGQGIDAVNNVKASVQRVLYNVPLTYYIDIDLDGVGPMANAVGGVSVTALDDIPKANISKGQQVILYGNDAKNYVQYRSTSITGSAMDRQARQEQFIKAYISKLFNNAAGNVNMILDVYNTALNYCDTNLDNAAVIYLAQCCISNGVNVSDIQSLQGTYSTREINGSNYGEFSIDTASTMQIVVDTFYTPVE